MEISYSWYTPRFSSRPINFFPFYINGVPQGLNTDVKLFADDTSLFSVVNNVSVSVSSLNNDLIKIRDWDFNWKMLFNTDPTKQVKEATFSTKKKFFVLIVPQLKNILV